MIGQSGAGFAHGMPGWETGVLVLKNWIQVGDAINYLGHHRQRTHQSPYKSWDLALIHAMVGDLDRRDLIVDLGASVLGGVRLLYGMGFSRIVGFDLAFSKFDRLIQLRDWLDLVSRSRRPTGPAYRLKVKNLQETGLGDESIGAVICLSVIEHGVDQDRFFAEVSRVLRKNGLLFMSTDYWEPKVDTSGRMMFGQPWTIFCRTEIEAMILLAGRYGLRIDGVGSVDYSCEDTIVVDYNHACTTIAMRFRKRRRSIVS